MNIATLSCAALFVACAATQVAVIKVFRDRAAFDATASGQGVTVDTFDSEIAGVN